MLSSSLFMASTSSNNASDPNSPNTTFVQADPSTFRTIVQKLTGAPDDPSIQKLPLTHPTRPATSPCPKRPAFKLQERRQSGKNLQINLNNYMDRPDHLFQVRQRGFLVSPVSPLDFFGARVSPTSPCEEEEERAIADKGFYLHPSPLNTPRSGDPPELLPLFPLKSPRESESCDHDRGDECSC